MSSEQRQDAHVWVEDDRCPACAAAAEAFILTGKVPDTLPPCPDAEVTP